MGPIEGYTVERKGDRVLLVFSDRAGDGIKFDLTCEDANAIGQALVTQSGPKSGSLG